LNGDYAVVNLTEDIVNCSGTCITFGANNVEFDCQGHGIDGDDSGTDYGIYMNEKSSNTVKNCIVTEFWHGIFIYNSDNNTLTGNTANSNNIYAIYLYNSDYNTLANNTANSNNVYGIHIYSSNNTLNSNKACNNTESDFYLGYGLGNSGDWNTCGNPDGWDDNGEEGCTYICEHEHIREEIRQKLSSGLNNLNFMTKVGEESHFCVIVPYNESLFSYQIDKSKGNVTVSHSNKLGCDEADNEDLILRYMNYSSFLKEYENTSATSIKEGHGHDYYLTDSRFVKKDPRDFICNEEFSEIYCDAVNDELNIAEMLFGGLFCCIELIPENEIDLSPLGYDPWCGIEIPFSDITLNCNDLTIYGNNSNGISSSNKSDVTIKNCHVRDYNTGININHSSNVRLINNVIEFNGNGIEIQNSTNITLLNSSINSNDGYGIYLMFSQNNTISESSICLNGVDIACYGDYCYENLGHNNTCNNSWGWNDAGTTGCTYACSGECLKGDANCDGTVSDFELLSYINLWVLGEVDDSELLEAIDNWAQ